MRWKKSYRIFMDKYQETIHNKEIEAVYSKNVIEFVTIAGEYCSFMEAADKLSTTDFTDKGHKLLSLLYLKATLLPKTENIFAETGEKFVAEDDYEYVKQKVAKCLGLYDVAIDVFEKSIMDNDGTTTLSLSETFADIYQDLKNFTLAYSVGNDEAMHEALWECRLNFEQYWGHRLIAALNALHNLYYGNEELDETSHNLTGDFSFQNINTDSWFITRRQNDLNI